MLKSLLLSLTLLIATSAQAGKEPYANVIPTNNGYIAEETMITPGGDEYNFPGFVYKELAPIQRMINFYGISGNADGNWHYSKWGVANFFTHFLYPSFFTTYRLKPNSQFYNYCTPQDIFTHAQPHTGQLLKYACTDQYNSTFVDHNVLTKLPNFDLALAVLKSRLYGWCLYFQKTKKIIPGDNCNEAKDEIELILTSIIDVKQYFDQRNYESLGQKPSHMSQDEEAAAGRLRNAFSRLSIR